MNFKVRVFLGEQLVDPADVPNIVIHSKTVDRIVNSVYERCRANVEDTSGEETDPDVEDAYGEDLGEFTWS